MCTQFCIEPKNEALDGILAAAERSLLMKRFIAAGDPLVTEGIVRPTNVVPVLAPGKDGTAGVFPMKWGFTAEINAARRLLINARVETASEKSLFKEAWKKHRCVIPASWYYEWMHFTDSNGKKRTGEKYMIQPRGDSVTWLAGLYRIEEGLPCFTVLTREPTETLRRIHDRMPLILPEDLLHDWIRPDGHPERALYFSLTDMVAEKAPLTEH